MTGRVARLVHPPATGARNMAVDEALMEVARGGGVALRFYRWDPPCLSLGRNQAARGAYDLEAAERSGIDVVRRPTGGRAVYHDRELTYSVVAPSGAWGGLRDSYRRINRALLGGLAELGADADEADRPPEGGTPAPSRRACFRDPLPGEIVARGRKLVGSAQWRHGGALLQHGSLLLHDDQSVVDRLRTDESPAAATADAGPPGAAPSTGPAAPGGDAPYGGESRPGAARPSGRGDGGAASLAELIPELPDPARLARALTRGFAEEFDLEPEAAELTRRLRSRASRLEERYRSEEWTWRR